MKRFAQNIILVIAAATVFFTGAGVTIINYCCASCSGQTLIMAQQHTCCAISHEQHTDATAPCCAATEAESHDSCETTAFSGETHCQASRLSIDIDAASFRPHVATPVVWISDNSLILASALLPDTTEFADHYSLFKSPPDIPPREYLSLIRVLII
ncbi:hypothetical protein M2451_003582 [Dysgonomonas sp. PFB1-18]|uniref:hypothetical protein n=1 Tax=unclassified Dysgonomonas TaxID=2630389 RepID=UPI0024742073|nr:MULTISPECIES: hypothetical protein [unclassified Dysgonomonas]MDH6310802.1 hypothetical protein [Dysgonomonas sp. PF1-14]MDH6340652.1 hypothetical protein [Dysgonomonas sp. PF1-16]MDH6382241.1 hypothetical protein [Dysgonomonas sp. PFB1-18]MDH6399622.1 hypothetical protein [Dysgonomonas sp. PF1-23]